MALIDDDGDEAYSYVRDNIPENIQKGMIIEFIRPNYFISMDYVDVKGMLLFPETGQKLEAKTKYYGLVVRKPSHLGWVDIIYGEDVRRLYASPGLEIREAIEPET